MSLTTKKMFKKNEIELVYVLLIRGFGSWDHGAGGF